MTTLNIRALQRAKEKIEERLAKIKEEAFLSTEFPEFKKYVGIRDGLQLALHLIEETDSELTGA
jgi:hypothetical protein